MNDRIEMNPKICHGKPVIKGTRLMVSTILGALAAEDTVEAILEDYPYIEYEDILAALGFASQVTQFEEIPYDLVAA